MHPAPPIAAAKVSKGRCGPIQTFKPWRVSSVGSVLAPGLSCGRDEIFAILVVSLWFLAVWGDRYFTSPVTTAALKGDRL